jgi:hypothetical protein
VARTGEPAAASAPFSFRDPTCSLATYNASLGGAADTRAFFQHAAEHHGKLDWDARYTPGAVLEHMRQCLTVKP